MYLNHTTLRNYFNSLPGHTEPGLEEMILIEDAQWMLADPYNSLEEQAEIIVKNKTTQKYYRYDAKRTLLNSTYVYDFTYQGTQVSPRRVETILWVPHRTQNSNAVDTQSK